ncbi:MAG: hypothetical protein GX118_07175, partial [Arcobacter butzleri]|nr:hypothetical protein [Aliarcobacter butzleri]
MDQNQALNELSNKFMDIEKVQEIYNLFEKDAIVESKVAMNLSMRTSVYDKELEKSDTIILLLEKLSDSSSMEARWAVAKNPHTPIEVLQKLSKDKVNLVRALVATNPTTPKEILSSFFSDE